MQPVQSSWPVCLIFLPSPRNWRNVVEFVGDKAEFGLTHLVKVKMLGWGGRSEAVFKPLPVKNGDVKLFTVVVYDDVGGFAEYMDAP
jgi:hypothetical protein